MDDYRVTRDAAQKKNPLDVKHRRILEFAQIMPYVFLIAWILFAVIDIYLHLKRG